MGKYYGIFSVKTGAYQGGIGFFETDEEAEQYANDAGYLDDDQSYVGEAEWARY